MANASPFSIFTLQDLSNDTKNTLMRGVLGLVVELWTFRSPGGLQILTFSKCWASPPHLAKVGLRHLWPLKFLESNFRGQKLLDCRFFYIIEKLLECRCLKWACMTHLDISNTSYGQKKGWSLKVRNRPNFHVCKWHVTNCWKAFDNGYNFALDLTSIKGLHTKL